MKTLIHVGSIAVFFLLNLARADAANITTNCYRANTDGWAWSYCLTKANDSASTDVLYYFHGANGSIYEWTESKYREDVYRIWGDKAPLVVTLSYGPIWLLAEKNSTWMSGLYEHFVKSALPQMERDLDLHPAHRFLAGASMGGYNATQVFLKNPELFTKVAVLCPAILPFNPYTTAEEISTYISRTHANATKVESAILLMKTFYPSPGEWAKGDAIVLAQTRATETSPELLVSGGLQDEYGFFEGAEAFTAAAHASGANAKWAPVEGGHCSWDLTSVTGFLVP